MTEAREQILQGALTFLGFVISIIAVVYFAGTYLPDVGEWTRLAALILLGVFFAFLGVALRGTEIGEPFFGEHLAWLRPTYVLYLLAIVSGIVAEFVFLAIDDVERPIKILVSLLLGVGLIVAVAWREKRRQGGDHAPDAASSDETE